MKPDTKIAIKSGELKLNFDQALLRKPYKNRFSMKHLPIVKELIGIGDPLESFDMVIKRICLLTEPLEQESRENFDAFMHKCEEDMVTLLDTICLWEAVAHAHRDTDCLLCFDLLEPEPYDFPEENENFQTLKSERFQAPTGHLSNIIYKTSYAKSVYRFIVAPDFDIDVGASRICVFDNLKRKGLMIGFGVEK